MSPNIFVPVKCENITKAIWTNQKKKMAKRQEGRIEMEQVEDLDVSVLETLTATAQCTNSNVAQKNFSFSAKLLKKDDNFYCY